jgi:peroxiredoxin
MKRTLFLLALVLVVVSGCKNRNSISVRGTVKNETKKYIYLSRLDVNTPVLLDSAKIRKNGTFSFKVKATQPDFYQLGFSETDFISLLANPGEKIKLNFTGKNLAGKYTVTGSEGSEKVRQLDCDLIETRRKLDSLSTLFTKASGEAGFDKRGPELEEQFRAIVKEQRKKNISFVIKNITSLASIKALYQRIDDKTYVLYDPKDLQYLKIVTDSLTKYYPESKHVQALASNFSREMSQMYSSQMQAMTKNLPEAKLDPDLMSINGKRIALSSLKGKYVLLTFWSARSQESIKENLQLKDFYKLYNKKGFEIYQISVDPNEADWRNAVKFDELPWISTREDDSSNLLNARLFNVRTLPSNFLFDKEGKIVATNIHGKTLQLKLEQLFN